VAKYDALRTYLAARPEHLSRVTMSFGEVGALVGSLPASAWDHRAWWANDSKVQAQAWRGAGWHVESVHQGAGQVVFARGVVGGSRIAARGTRPDPGEPMNPASRPLRVPAIPADEGMPESAAQALLVAHLVGQGWKIQRVADTTAKEPGIDVLATREGQTLAVEVKGYPGRRYADPRRADEVKPTAPSVQARHWYSQAILKAMLTRNDHPEYDIAIAVPEAATYQALYQRTRGSLRQLNITLFFITGNGHVREV
jgi:hypothetical protein